MLTMSCFVRMYSLKGERARIKLAQIEMILEYQIVNLEPLYGVHYMEEENTQYPSFQEN